MQLTSNAIKSQMKKNLKTILYFILIKTKLLKYVTQRTCNDQALTQITKATIVKNN